jgi:cell division protein FtsQ
MLNRRKNRRKQEQKRRWQLPAVNWHRWTTSAASLASIAAVVSLVAWALNQPIEKVSIAGQFQRVAPADIERAVKQRVRGKGLVSANLEEIRQAIDSLPWVDTVSVQRAWPRGLHVTVTEQIPAARWGASGLINMRGELFASETRYMPPELAQLSGPSGKENVVAQRYLAAQGRLVEAGMRITALRLDARGAWEFDLSNGVTVRLGRRDVDKRFDTFLRTALRQIARRADAIRYVDMRYTNGFAIGWRDAAALHKKNEGHRQNV